MRKIKRAANILRKSEAAKYIREFGDNTTLHGIPYIIKPNFHYLETLLWVIIVALSLTGAISLIMNSWNRYYANPTVISLEKNFRDWNITFPAATVCFLERLNETLAAEYILEKWGVDENTTDYRKYHDFLNSVVNLTYHNLDDFHNYTNDKEFTSFTGEELAEIARRVMVKMIFHSNIFNSAYKDITFHETLTEMGICYTFSGIVSNYITLSDEPQPNVTLPTCNYLNSLCYSRIEDLPAIIKYYIHSPFELPDISDKYFIVVMNMERDTAFRFQEMVASQELRRLKPRQRQCRFVDEPTGVGNKQVYSYNLCRMSCRKMLAHKFCGCAPYFYMKEGDNIPVCGVEGLACLSKYKENIIRHRSLDDKKIDCPCLFQCEFTAFYIDKDNERRWTYPVPSNIRFRWAIEHYSKTRHKRDIIFGFEDLLVSLGGTAAFFLGCSVLSFVEVAYFFTLRLFWYIARKVKNKQRKPQTMHIRRVEFIR